MPPLIINVRRFLWTCYRVSDVKSVHCINGFMQLHCIIRLDLKLRKTSTRTIQWQSIYTKEAPRWTTIEVYDRETPYRSSSLWQHSKPICMGKQRLEFRFTFVSPTTLFTCAKNHRMIYNKYCMNYLMKVKSKWNILKANQPGRLGSSSGRIWVSSRVQSFEAERFFLRFYRFPPNVTHLEDGNYHADKLDSCYFQTVCVLQYFRHCIRLRTRKLGPAECVMFR